MKFQRHRFIDSSKEPDEVQVCRQPPVDDALTTHGTKLCSEGADIYAIERAEDEGMTFHAG
jgi:hypothetical protein